MLFLRPGSQAHLLATLLSVVGEYPTYALHLLGNERVYRALVNKLTEVQTIRDTQTDAELTVRLLKLSGKTREKSIRFYKAGLPILEWLGADEYYRRAFWDHQFPGDAAHKDRNYRVAESVAMCMRSGIEFRPYRAPLLQNEITKRSFTSDPIFYPARSIKQVGMTEQNKTMFTRLTGAIFSDRKCFAVYNTRSAAMKWSGMGEFKTRQSLIEIARMNTSIREIDSAILFGSSDEVALRTLEESEKNRHLEFRFDGIYHRIHFIPLDENGIRQLSILTLPNSNERILDLLFEPEYRSYNRGHFEYDAYIDGTYVMSHLDGDLAKLIRIRRAIENTSGRYEMLCYPHQVSFLREYLSHLVQIKTIDMDSVEAELGLERRNHLFAR